jgi:hypothetical protein
LIARRCLLSLWRRRSGAPISCRRREVAARDVAGCAAARFRFRIRFRRLWSRRMFGHRSQVELPVAGHVDRRGDRVEGPRLSGLVRRCRGTRVKSKLREARVYSHGSAKTRGRGVRHSLSLFDNLGGSLLRRSRLPFAHRGARQGCAAVRAGRLARQHG